MVEKREKDNGVGNLPTFLNPAYESSREGSTGSRDSADFNETSSHNSSSNSKISSRSKSSKNSKNSQRRESVVINAIDPLEDLRNLTKEICPGVQISTLRKESMSDRDSAYNFPTIISPSSSKRSSQALDSSFWDLNLVSQNSALFKKDKKRESASEDSVFDIDEILNIKKKYFGFTSKQWVTLAIFSYVNIFSAIVVNLQAPFYPAIAGAKGATEIETGFVFGSFEFIVFILSPIFGKYMNDLGPRRVFNTGILVTGTCSILFGFLTFVEDRTLFIALSFIFRIFEAVGTAGHVTATFTLIAIEFHDSIFTIFASMETCSGVGLILGPLLGSLLYEAGASFGTNFQFLLPFVTLGGILFLGALLAYFVMPKNSEVPLNQKTEKMDGFWSILKIPSVALAALSIFSAAVSIGFHGPTLEPHTKQFELENISKGAIFIINGGTYAISAPLIGRLCDRMPNQKGLIIVGSLFIFCGYVFIGPAPIVPFEAVLWLTCFGLFIQGLGLSFSFVSGFTQAMKGSLKAGCPDSVGTYGLVSGLWMSMFALGNCVGPSAGGALTYVFDYRTSTLFVMGLQIFVIGVTFIFLCKDRISGNLRSNKDSELEIHGGGGVIAVKEAKFFNEFSSAPPPPKNKKETPNTTVPQFKVRAFDS